MLNSFLESIKYVNHLIPIAFLRIFMGYYWFKDAINKYQVGLFSSQVFIDEYRSQEIMANYPNWYQSIFEGLVYPYWSIVSNVIIGIELFIGISLVIGFLVRPASILGLLICLHFTAQGEGYLSTLYVMSSAIFVTLLLAGAGRCIGVDYYFFKRNRGVWW